MEYINLRHSDLKVSRICMGGCPLGGYGWGKVEEKDLIHSVHLALDSGINFFDTADTYGLGKSEETLGHSLAGKRARAVIATKFGVRVGEDGTRYDNSPAWIEQALSGSLRRLNTDYIDLYQIHYRDRKTPIEDVLETLMKLREKGYIRYLGLSNIYEEDIPALRDCRGAFTSFQDEYSLACRKNEKSMFTIEEELALTPLTWGSLGQGILSGKYSQETVFGPDDRRSREEYVNFHGEKLLHNLRIVDLLKEIASECGKTVPSVAIRFILDYMKESAVLIGIKRPEQLRSNLKAMDWSLNTEQMQRLLEVSKEPFDKK